MPGFGYGRFGRIPFGRWDWAKQVLYDYQPTLDRQEDEQNGNPVLALVTAQKPSYDKIKNKIESLLDVRDPLSATTQYNDVSAIVLGQKVVEVGETLQRGYTAKVTAFGEFKASNARFDDTHTGKDIVVSGSSRPENNKTVVLASVIDSTTVVTSPPLSKDDGPLKWELRTHVEQPKDRTSVEVLFGDTSSIAPGWRLFDGFSEFEILSRKMMDVRTEREGNDAIIENGVMRLTNNKLSLDDTGKRIVLSGSADSNDDTYEITRVLRKVESGTNAIIDSTTPTLSALRGLNLEEIPTGATTIAISGAAHAGNNGVFALGEFLSTDVVQYINASATLPEPNNGSLKWSFGYGDYDSAEIRRIGPSRHVSTDEPLVEHLTPFHWALLKRPVLTLKGTIPEVKGAIETIGFDAKITSTEPPSAQYPTGLFVVESDSTTFPPDLHGSGASVSPDSIVTGLFGMQPSSIGLHLTLESSAPWTAYNNNFVITEYLGSTSVKIDGPGIPESGLTWTCNSPLRNKIIALRGPGDNNTYAKIVMVEQDFLTLEQPSVPVINDAGPLLWEIRSPTQFEAIGEFQAMTPVQVRPPALLPLLAVDFGIDVDLRESENRQRSWVRHHSQWIGIKGNKKSYEIVGSISGFDVTAKQLFRITSDYEQTVPFDNLHELGESESGRFGEDGILLPGPGGRVKFQSASASFKPSDVSRCIRIKNPPGYIGPNSKLFTIDEYLSKTSVVFQSSDTAVVPDYGPSIDGSLFWAVTRLYTDLPPSQPRYDDMDPTLMTDLINPRAVMHIPGMESPIPPYAYGPGDVLYVADAVGTPGNNITITHLTGSSLSVSVSGRNIQVTIVAGVTTANDLIAAVNTSPASTLVTAYAIGQSGTGHPVPFSYPAYMSGGLDNFAIDKMCWEDSFDSSLDVEDNSSTASIIAAGATCTLNGLNGLSPYCLGRFAIVSGAAIDENNGVFKVSQFHDPQRISVDNPNSAYPDPNSGSINVKLCDLVIADKELVSENTWDLIISGPASVIRSVDSGNWRIVDANGAEFYAESTPTVYGSNFKVRVFSAVDPADGLSLPSPIDLHYDCSVITDCSYCSSHHMLLTIRNGSILEEEGYATRLEQVFERTMRRMMDVKPAHVTIAPRLQTEVQATLNWSAELADASSIGLPLYAMLTAHYDDIPGDELTPDSILLASEIDGPFFTINSGSVDSVVAGVVTMSGFSGPLPDVTGQTVEVSGASTPGNNGSFIITGYTSSTSGSTIQYTNASADAADLSNGSLTVATRA